MRQTREQIKEAFERDTQNHTMEILLDDGLYRHLKFTNNGSSVYRFDIHTFPGYLAVTGDMGDYMFTRIADMFEFFKMDKHDFNYKHVINPGYWAEKCVSVDKQSNIEEFDYDTFKDNVMQEYENFAEQFQDEDEEAVTEAYPEDTQSYEQMLAELKEAIEDEVLSCDHNEVRAYDAAMEFEWKSEDGKLEFDMRDFWDYSNTDFTYHYIWILYAIVWSIGQYESEKQAQATGMVAV